MCAGRGEPGPAVHGEEIAVGQIDRARTQRAFQPVDEFLFAGVVGAELSGLHPPVAAGHERDQAGLRAGCAGGAAERLDQRLVCRQLQAGAVEPGDGQTEHGRAGLVVRALGALDVGGGLLFEERLHRHRTQTDPGPGQRRGGRDLAGQQGAAAQMRGRFRQHAGIALAAEQGQAQDHRRRRGPGQ
jgi:hypothetical protein